MNNITAFNEGTAALALENGYPVVTPSGTFVPDARAAWLVEAVETWLVESQEPRNGTGWFHASSLGRTDEELIAEYRGELPDGHDARRLRVFDLGHDRDASWKRYLAGAGLSTIGEIDREMRINWLRLMGTCDDIVHGPGGELCIVEIKTKAQYLFDRLQAPDEAHRLQVNAYMAGLGIHQAIVLYEAKNDQSIKAFYEEHDPVLWQGIVTRLRGLRARADQPVQTAEEANEGGKPTTTS